MRELHPRVVELQKPMPLPTKKRRNFVQQKGGRAVLVDAK
jgi:hypothetical protein